MLTQPSVVQSASPVIEQPPPLLMPVSRALPCYDGAIYMQASSEPVPYHFSVGFRGELTRTQCDSMALLSCSLACMSADMVRGRVTSAQLRRRLTYPCLRRLETMSQLVALHLDEHEELRSELCTMPVIPRWVNGMVLTPYKCEITIHVTIGRFCYFPTIIMIHTRGHWVCSHADFG